MKYKTYVTVILVINLFISTTYSKCPEFNNTSHLTQNGKGNSAYADKFILGLFNALILENSLNIKKPILIAGGGYGEGTTELLSLGADHIYLNDLDSKNLSCARQYIENKFNVDKHKVQYIIGDITHQNTLKKIKDNTLGFIFAKHLIHFLNADQINHLILEFNRKLEPNGVLVIVFENIIFKEQAAMISDIYKEYNSINIHQNKNIDDIVIKFYKNTFFGTKNVTCSIDAYKSTSNEIRMLGFPCILENSTGILNLNMILPSFLSRILVKNGFLVLLEDSIGNGGTFIIVAKKNTSYF